MFTSNHNTALYSAGPLWLELPELGLAPGELLLALADAPRRAQVGHLKRVDTPKRRAHDLACAGLCSYAWCRRKA